MTKRKFADYPAGIVTRFKKQAVQLGKRYAAKGYKVDTYLESESRDDFINAWRTEGIYAYVFAGHGAIADDRRDDDWYGFVVGDQTSITPFEVFPPYKLQAVVALACGTGNSIPPKYALSLPATHAPETPKDMLWFEHMADNNGFFLGYRGSVNKFEERERRVFVDPSGHGGYIGAFMK